MRGAFGQQVSCKLVRLPFMIFNPGNSDQVTKILCAVTDMLDDEDMLLSGHDYVVLIDNCRKDRSILIPEDDYSNVLPFLETILEEDEIAEEEDDVVDLNLLYNSELRDDVDSSVIINQIDLLEEVKQDEVVVDLENIRSEHDKNEFHLFREMMKRLRVVSENQRR